MSPSNISHAKILAIDPGTKDMGIALLDNGELLYHGVKTFNTIGTPHERLQTIRACVIRLIQDFNPTVLVVEKTFFGKSRSAALVNVLSDEIQMIGKRRKLNVVSFASNTVRKALCGNGAGSKKDVARMVVSRYPYLNAFLGQNKRWKEKYHANMFDAIALALMAAARGHPLRTRR